MNPEIYENLADGYEEALDAVSELADSLSDIQDSIIDSLSDMHGDLQAIICTLRECQKALRHSAQTAQ